MAVISRELDLLVTAAPGTASTSLIGWAVNLPGAMAVPTLAQRCPANVDRKHATIAQLRGAGLLSPQTAGAVLTSTRNPFDYWHAEWFRARKRWALDARDPQSWVHGIPGMGQRIDRAVALDFPAWLEIELGTSADRGDRWHLNPGHIAEANVVLRMESLEADLQRVLPHVAATGGPIPHINATSGRGRYEDAYTDRARWLVTQVHAPDLHRFHYAFHESP